MQRINIAKTNDKIKPIKRCMYIYLYLYMYLMQGNLVFQVL